MREGHAQPKRRSSSTTWALRFFAVVAVAPFALLGIALLDDYVFHTRWPYKVYTTLGIWEPVEGLYSVLTDLFN